MQIRLTELRRRARARARLFSLFCLSVFFSASAGACSAPEESCAAGDPFCNPLAFGLTYQQPYVAIGSTLVSGNFFGAPVFECSIFESEGLNAWRRVAAISDCAALNDFARGPDGLFIAAGGTTLGDDSGECRMYSSYDRETWTSQPCTATRSLTDAEYVSGRGFYVANRAGEFQFSVDGRNEWRAFTPPSFTESIRILKHFDGRFYVGETNGVLYSPDPESTAFTAATAPAGDYFAIDQMRSGRLIGVHGTSSGANIGAAYSDDGLTWTAGTGIFANRPGPTNPASLAVGPDFALAAGSSGETSYCYVDWTEDGETWNGGYVLDSSGMICIANVSYVGGVFFAGIIGVRSDGNAFFRYGTSADPRQGLASWTFAEAPGIIGPVLSAADFPAN